MRNAVLFAATSVLIASPSFGADPNRWHGPNGEIVIWHNGTNARALNGGANDIDGLHKFSCKNPAGCIVIVSASILEQRSGETTTCAYVDGVAGAPGCNPDPQGDSQIISRLHEQLRVKAGAHTVKTVVTTSGGTLLGWAIDYTIYDQPN